MPFSSLCASKASTQTTQCQDHPHSRASGQHRLGKLHFLYVSKTPLSPDFLLPVATPTAKHAMSTTQSGLVGVLHTQEAPSTCDLYSQGLGWPLPSFRAEQPHQARVAEGTERPSCRSPVCVWTQRPKGASNSRAGCHEEDRQELSTRLTHLTGV